MITRLRVSGFKNLDDVDIRFGPFTCIAGANGVGKSNLFDAISFLSALADRPFIDAARCVRDEKNRSTEVRSLFFRLGDDYVDEMSFEVEMLVPVSGQDELGQAAKAAITFLRYNLIFGYEAGDEVSNSSRIVLKREELTHINKGDAPKHLAFDHSREWRNSVVQGVRRGGPFISTEAGGEIVVKLHQDGASGRPRSLRAATLPRTVLSSTNSIESPTALLAKREMQSWRLLQLEPSALREPDSFTSPTHVGIDGAHLASTLVHLARHEVNGNGNLGQSAIYSKVANRLSELVEDVRSVSVDIDHKRELLTLQVIDRNKTHHAARALSDGTLRFLALAILELDPHASGLLCFEEPENGIHPERIQAILRLLKDIAVYPMDEVGKENPLRQVIVNTHSPSVVGLVQDADLLVARPKTITLKGKRCSAVEFAWLSDTWRAEPNNSVRPIPRGALMGYLNPLSTAIPSNELGTSDRKIDGKVAKSCAVKDRLDLQQLMLNNVEWDKNG